MSTSTAANIPPVSEQSYQQSRAATPDTKAPSTVSPSLHDILLTLYDPSKWGDPPYLQITTTTWYPAYKDGLTALNSKRYKQAAQYFYQAVSKAYRMPSIDNHRRSLLIAGIIQRRGFALYKLHRFEDALSDIVIAIRMIVRITEPDLYLLAADIQLAMGNQTGALKSCEEALQFSLKARPPSKRKVLIEAEEQIMGIIEQLKPREKKYEGARLDPVANLPLDIIELVMQHGLSSDQYFALKCTWVSRSWKQTLESVSSIWKTYTYNAEAARTAIQKRKAWAQNAGHRFNEIRLLHVDTKTAVKSINSTWKSYFRGLQTLKLEGTTMNNLDVIRQFGQSHSASYDIKTLHLHSLNRNRFTDTELDLGLLTPQNRATIEELCISGLSLEQHDPPTGEVDGSGYAALRHLSLNNCLILPRAHKAVNGAIVVDERLAQEDHVHATLRRAISLESLSTSTLYGFLHLASGASTSSPRSSAISVSPLAIPPFEGSLRVTVIRLKILASFAPTGIEVGKLISIELMINGGDARENLMDWLKSMKNVERLTIVSVRLSCGTASQLSPRFSLRESKLEEHNVGLDAANTANRNLINMLNEDPLLCSKLKELHLSNMYTPEASLLAWVLARKSGSSPVSPVTSLSLTHCTYISSSSDRQLRQHIKVYENVELGGITRLNWKGLCESWDKSFIAKKPDELGGSTSEYLAAVPEIDSKPSNDRLTSF